MERERLRSPISDAELERRWKAARAVMEQAGLDALVMQNTSDWVGGYVRWFTDIPAANGYPRTVAFYPDRPMTVVEMGPFDTVRDDLSGNAMYRGAGRVAHTPSFVSVNYTARYDVDLLAADLERNGARRIGVLAPGAMPSAMIDTLREKGFTLIDASDDIDTVKAIKSAEEIEHIKAVAALQDAVFAKVCETVAPGMTDIDVANIAQAEAHRLGSDQGILLGSSSPLGVSSRFAGRAMQGRRIASGEHFSLLIEVNGPAGLYTEIARTIVLGQASSHLRDSFALMKAAQDHTLSLLKPGVKASDVAAAHDEWMRGNGLPPETRLYAHGQGTDMVERPLVRRDETMTIAEGMCLAVHPGFDDGTVFSVICDNYMIEAQGPGPCLHKTEKKIFEL